MSKRVLLGMSGGVDSTVAALLLKRSGYEVIGATMLLCESGRKTCEEAKELCEKLNIEHHILDLRKEFHEYVISDFIKSYENAITPNPCIECNKYLKFDLFYKKSKEYMCDYIATGHYAKIEYSEKYKQHVIKKAENIKKDQSYVLYGIKKEILPYILFPLGSFKSKDEIRKVAEESNLEVAKKPDSQEICFVPDDDYVKFLRDNTKIEIKQGNIVDKQGKFLEKHNGLIKYTIGQRKGMGISSKEPLYIINLDKEKNQIVVGTEKDIYSKELFAKEVNFIVNVENNEEIKSKIRYNSKEAKSILIKEDDIVKIEFEKPQRAITKGQSVVFYKDDILLGGGKII